MKTKLKEKQYFYSIFLLSILLISFLVYVTINFIAQSEENNSFNLLFSVYYLYLIFLYLALDMMGATVFTIISSLFFITYYFISSSKNYNLILYTIIMDFTLYLLNNVYKKSGNLILRQNIVLEDWSKKCSINDAEIREIQARISKNEERLKRHNKLTGINTKFVSTLDKNEIERICINETKEIISKGDVVIKEIKERSQSLDFVNRWILEKKMPLFIENIKNDFRFENIVLKSKYLSIIAVPIKEDAKISGINENDARIIEILRANSLKENEYKEEDIRLLSMIGYFLSIALTNCKLYQKTEELAIMDSLTRVYTRRYFFEKLEDECIRAEKFNTPLSVGMMDIDFFKRYNDAFGHQAGDIVLKKIAKIIKDNLRDTDLVGRYGGEEFIILMPMANIEYAYAKLEMIRKKIEELKILTVSGGVSSFENSMKNKDKMVENSDKALYEAKNMGRNIVHKYNI